MQGTGTRVPSDSNHRTYHSETLHHFAAAGVVAHTAWAWRQNRVLAVLGAASYGGNIRDAKVWVVAVVLVGLLSFGFPHRKSDGACAT